MKAKLKGNSVFPFNSAPKDSNGKPITKPRNLLGGTCKGTKTRDFLTTKVGFATVGDPYLDPGRYEQIKRLEEQKSSGSKEKKEIYKPSDSYKTKFEHLK